MESAQPDQSLAKSSSAISTREENDHRERRFLIRRPRALQYFHQGVLKKAQEKERVAGQFELFFDLLYVALVANFADYLSEEPSGNRLVVFLLIFTPAWHAWADVKELNNNYYNDDVVQRIYLLWIMALLVLYGNNAVAVGEDLHALRITVGTYMVIRFSQVVAFTYQSIGSRFHRIQTMSYFGLELVVFCVLMPLYLESVSARAKIAVAVIGIISEQLNYFLSFGPWIGRWLELEYRTALDIDHENDRYTAFTIIVLGEFTYAILVGSPAAGGLTTGLLRAAWTLVIAFCFNSMYVYEDGSLETVHPCRRSVWTAFAWLMIHLPMAAGMLIAGHVSAEATREELSYGQRWLWGGGLGLSYLTLYLLALLFRDADASGFLILPKHIRIAPRLAGAIIMALLPLSSSEDLSDTSLLSIGAAFGAFVVIWETAGGLERGACFLEDWR